MRNFFIKIALFILRKHWITPHREADVTLPTYYLDIRELKIPEGKAITIKKVPSDFTELYFLPSIVTKILDSINPKIDTFNVRIIEDPNHEFKIVLKVDSAGDLREANLIDDQQVNKIL